MTADPGFLMALGMAGAASIGGGWWCLQRLAQARLLEDMPTSRIRSAAQGYVELYGVLREGPGEPLAAPLTGRPCLWWRYRIEEYRQNGKHKSWRVVESAASEAWLVLEDVSGQCLIDPLGAEVRPAHREVWHGERRHPRREQVHGLLGGLLAMGRRYRYTEERLHAGDPLYALGEFRTSGGGRQGLDLAAAQAAVVREWKQDFRGLLGRFDRDGDGQLSDDEWRLVRLAAQLEAEDRHARDSRAPERNHLRRPPEGLPFLLSCKGEDELARTFRWQAAGGALLCLGGALALASLLGAGG
ncbi:E3 ubiquitin ligase family protein [Pseudomonas stutzeri]|nr:E3 ubiquitin ligase family protein [Stutzerimonas stutzeri]